MKRHASFSNRDRSIEPRRGGAVWAVACASFSGEFPARVLPDPDVVVAIGGGGHRPASARELATDRNARTLQGIQATRFFFFGCCFHGKG